MALVRGVFGDEAKRACGSFAQTLIASGHPGENLVKLTSVEGKTDFQLVRSILTPKLVAVIAAYFRKVAGTEDFLLPYMGLQLRHFDPAAMNQDALVPFHQDVFAVPVGVRMLNCWTMLYPEECGKAAPGLDFIPLRLPAIAIEKNPTSKAYQFLEADHDRLTKLRRAHPPITPTIRLGDVLAFNELAMHRTSVGSGYTRARVSAEVRVIAATPYVMDWQKEEAAAHVFVGNIRWASAWHIAPDGHIRADAFSECRLSDH